jgi:hypothetical protein
MCGACASRCSLGSVMTSTQPEFTYHAPHLISKLSEVREWCWDEHVPCTRYGFTWIFECDEDRIKFVLRWG